MARPTTTVAAGMMPPSRCPHLKRSPAPVDPQFHGTFTMSEMVGDDGQGNQVGIAPGAKRIACHNMDRHGVGSPAHYIECFDWLIPRIPWASHNLRIQRSSAEGCNLTTLSAAVRAGSGSRNLCGRGGRQLRSACTIVKTTPSIFAASVSVGATDSKEAPTNNFDTKWSRRL